MTGKGTCLTIGKDASIDPLKGVQDNVSCDIGKHLIILRCINIHYVQSQDLPNMLQRNVSHAQMAIAAVDHLCCGAPITMGNWTSCVAYLRRRSTCQRRSAVAPGPFGPASFQPLFWKRASFPGDSLQSLLALEAQLSNASTSAPLSTPSSGHSPPAIYRILIQWLL